MRLTGLVVSDLHLFSARSEYARYEERFLDLCKGKDLLVLNGDIVDFKWSQLGSFEATADATIGWLCERLDEVPKVVYILGNHDRVAEFYPYLDELSQDRSQFAWDSSCWQEGDCLFFHGDLPGVDESITKRQPAELKKAKGKTANRLYDFALSSKLAQGSRLLHQPHKSSRRVHRHVQDEDEIKRVFTGHTHWPYDGLIIDDKQFYNTGSMVRTMPFNPVEFILEKSHD